jgi:hypothetical protein
MPSKIFMNISNGNNFYPQINRNMTNNNLESTIKKQTNSPLNGQMIQRIHSARAGCGSCGRH